MNDEAKIVEIIRLYGELDKDNKTYIANFLADKQKDEGTKGED
jgi:hypothetical protein|tara:strand:+ start:216 stop:344 length:129 start_codon:yes stop_codon:yes gene_type:complete